MDRHPDYYAFLASAIAQYPNDSFQARGATYDRAWQSILIQLRAGGKYSEDDIARERSEFLRAVQRIEFGEGQPPEKDSSAETDRPESSATEDDQPDKSRRPFLRHLRSRPVELCVAFVIVAFACATIREWPDFSLVMKRIGDGSVGSWPSQMMRALVSTGGFPEWRSIAASGSAQRAVLYEESALQPAGTAHVGHAVWRAYPEASATARDPRFVLSVDVEIPQNGLTLKILAQRSPERDAVLSHTIEFRFMKSAKLTSDAVEGVVGILMKNDELSRGIELVGKTVRVQPGVFLMGLSGADADVRKNIILLKERPWLDIPIVYKNGSRAILAIEKGTTGQNAVDEILQRWAQF